MPIYEFKCEECEEVISKLVKMGTNEVEDCECGGSRKRIMSASSFVLKGTGWYETDFKHK